MTYRSNAPAVPDPPAPSAPKVRKPITEIQRTMLALAWFIAGLGVAGLCVGGAAVTSNPWATCLGLLALGFSTASLIGTVAIWTSKEPHLW